MTTATLTRRKTETICFDPFPQEPLMRFIDPSPYHPSPTGLETPIRY